MFRLGPPKVPGGALGQSAVTAINNAQEGREKEVFHPSPRYNSRRGLRPDSRLESPPLTYGTSVETPERQR
jgi:hypothetical protein